MPQREVEIVNKLGLHARASAKLTQLASKFAADVWLSRNGRRVNAKSIMGVMMLAAGKGSRDRRSRPTARTPTRRSQALVTLIDGQVRGRRVRWRAMGKPETATVEAALAAQPGASFTLHGAGVSGGIAIGHAHLISSARLEVAHYEIAPPRRSTRRSRASTTRSSRCAASWSGCTRRAGRRTGRDGRVPRPAPDDPRRLDAVAGAARADPHAPLQRRMGAGAPDGDPGRTVRRDRGRRTCASARPTCCRWSSAC